MTEFNADIVACFVLAIMLMGFGSAFFIFGVHVMLEALRAV